MSRVALVSPSLESGDAVSNDILGMYQVLSAQGHEVEIFANSWRPGDYAVRRFEEAPAFVENPCSCIIYHFAFGWEAGLELLKAVHCKRVVKYHNVTPPEFFDGIDADYSTLCHRGREHLELIARANFDLYLSDSEYNAREMEAAGVDGSPSLVVPPFHHIDKLKSLDPDPEVLRLFGQSAVTNILMVGRLAPNKKHELLIETFAAYQREYNPNSRLLIVGREDPRLRLYNERIRSRVRELGLEGSVFFVGGVTDEALKAYYLVARAFVMTSEHEGFCVPLVEAMALKVPIVAIASTAVPGTVGKAGFVWTERDPELLAGSVHLIASDDSVRSALAACGWQRYQELFSNESASRQLSQALSRIL